MLWLVAIAVVINVSQYSLTVKSNFLDADSNLLFGDSELISSGLEDKIVRTNWLPWIVLAEFAPGSTIYIPSKSFFNRQSSSTKSRLFSYGKARRVTPVKMSSLAFVDQIDIEKQTVLSLEGVSDGRTSYVYVIKTDTHSQLTPGPVEGMSLIKDLPILPHHSFLLVEWVGPPDPFHADLTEINSPFYGAFIDINLLPEDIRSALESL